MTIAPARSLVQSYAPDNTAARYATYGALALFGSLLIALAGKVTVTLVPTPSWLLIFRSPPWDWAIAWVR